MDVLEELKAQGRNVKELPNGAIYDLDKGRIVANPGGGRQPITSDNAKAMLARRKAVGLRSRLRGLVRGTGVQLSNEEVEDITDELLAKSGDAAEAITAHLAATFMQSKNLRGMSEAYDKLMDPLTGDRRQREEDTDTGEALNITVMLAQFIQHNYPSSDTRNENRDVIDVNPE